MTIIIIATTTITVSANTIIITTTNIVFVLKFTTENCAEKLKAILNEAIG